MPGSTFTGGQSIQARRRVLLETIQEEIDTAQADEAEKDISDPVLFVKADAPAHPFSLVDLGPHLEFIKAFLKDSIPEPPRPITVFDHGDARVFVSPEHRARNLEAYKEILDKYASSNPATAEEADDLCEEMSRELLPGHGEEHGRMQK